MNHSSFTLSWLPLELVTVSVTHAANFRTLRTVVLQGQQSSIRAVPLGMFIHERGEWGPDGNSEARIYNCSDCSDIQIIDLISWMTATIFPFTLHLYTK